jgi:tetratricopeptide (TPR) repeat protein
MTYEKEEQARLIRQRSKQAIALAMEGRWREAVEANRGIIEGFPNDVDSYNRLGRAYMELGEYSLAREAYGRARELDPHNTIAKKNLRRLAHLRETGVTPEEVSYRVEPHVFIEETGKAGVVKLYRLASKEVLARVDAGDKVNLKIADSSLIVENNRQDYLGLVEPRDSQRLIRLMKGGNQYSATVISASEDNLAVIIREVYQHPSQVGQLSFPSKGFGSVRSYVSDRILRRQLEYEDSAAAGLGYSVEGGDEAELLTGEPEPEDDGNEDEQEVQ